MRFSEREGLGALTMRKLATELGLSSMNSYHYVENKQALFDLVADQVLGQIPEPPPGPPWDERLTEVFETGRAVLLRYRGVSDHLLVRSVGLGNTERLADVVRSILGDAGFDSETIDRGPRVLTYLLLGAVSQELASTTAAAGRRRGAVRFTDDAEVFTYGLELMLDGLRARGREMT